MDGKYPVRDGDTVEAELLGPGGSAPRARRHASPEKPGLLTRLRFFLAAALGLAAFALFAVGALLTSTVIGALIGVPLLLAGAALFFLVFKLLTLGSGSSFVIRRF